MTDEDVLHLESQREAYQEFLESKAVIAPERGMDSSTLKMNPALFPHQADIARWAIRGGNRAIFAAFGLGKTLIQIQILESLLTAQPGSGLIVCPLGVKAEFVRDAKRFFDIDFHYVRTNDEHQDWISNTEDRFFITNYERVRDGDIDPNRFTVVSLDEASVLRSFGSKTYQTFLTLFERVPFKFVCTATPSPNRFKELIHYAGFLGIMDTGQALTRFFKRDSAKAGNLTIHPHKNREFLLWIATWATFCMKPSDLGHDDTGYDLPPVEIHKHRLPVDYATAGYDSWGQGKLIRNAATSLSDASREKRDSMADRIKRAREIVDAGQPDQHWIIWHDLEDERRAIEKAFPEAVTAYGSQDLEIREQIIADFSDGKHRILATKASISGSGCNFQRHCYSAIFLGLNYKANDLMQAIHRIARFLQTHVVQIHLIYTESEDPIYEELMRKTKQHEELVSDMGSIIREFGLNNAKHGDEMRRAIGVVRQQAKGDLYTTVHNDNVMELQGLECFDAEAFASYQRLDAAAALNGDKLKPWQHLAIRQGAHRFADNSVDLIVTSWPFSDHYEYTESYNDFGHNDGDTGFFEQMQFLTPELIRVLAPGRMYCVHAKDRIVYGSVSGDGMYTVNPFSDKCVEHLRKHGLRYCGRITVVTDVVRENNQTYRLGHSENAKDGTKMGVGSPEYVLLFRKLPSDTSKGYADVPVPKKKPDVLCTEHEWGTLPADIPQGTADGPCVRCGAPYGTTEPHPMPFTTGLPIIPGTGYGRSAWQIDAHAFWRSNGDRFLTPDEIASMPMDDLRRLWHEYSKAHVYDFGEHIQIAEEMEKRGILPSSFMALDPPNPGSPWVWDDVARMRTLNTDQGRKGWEQHVCPLQLDIIERLIERYSAKGELVLDPFGGLGSVAYSAILQGRRGYSIELNEAYWKDSKSYCRAAEQKVSMPTLFDMEPTT